MGDGPSTCWPSFFIHIKRTAMFLNHTLILFLLTFFPQDLKYHFHFYTSFTHRCARACARTHTHIHVHVHAVCTVCKESHFSTSCQHLASWSFEWLSFLFDGKYLLVALIYVFLQFGMLIFEWSSSHLCSSLGWCLRRSAVVTGLTLLSVWSPLCLLRADLLSPMPFANVFRPVYCLFTQITIHLAEKEIWRLI